MRILVTGAAGFVGSHVVDQLVTAGHDVVQLDIMLPAAHCDAIAGPTGVRTHLAESTEVVSLAVAACDPALELLNDKERADLLSTLVAYTGTYRIEGDTWTTKVDVAWNPEWVGTEQVRDGLIQTMHSVVNPDKLGHLGPVSDMARLPGKETGE